MAASRLVEAGATPSHVGSKLLRALGDEIPAAVAGQPPSRHSSAAAVLQHHLTHLVGDLRMLDPLVRADAPDAVHRMRVTTRRLRSAMSTFRPLLDRTVTDPLRHDLKWIAGTLGQARDAEVMRERLLTQLEDEQRDLATPGLLSFLDEDLRNRYRRAHDRCVDSMRTDRYLGLVDRLTTLTASPPWTERALDKGQDVLRHRVDHDWRRLERAVHRLEADDTEDVTTRLHDVRKAAKRVRYAAEPLTPYSGKNARRFVKAVTRVQSLLGDHQDSAMSRRELIELGRRTTAEGESAFALGALSAREEHRIRDQRSEFLPVWQKATRTRLRNWLR
jgi:CHAD domain-containing protein